MKSVHFTPLPNFTGAAALELTEPFFRRDTPTNCALSPMRTFLILPQLRIQTWLPIEPIVSACVSA